MRKLAISVYDNLDVRIEYGNGEYRYLYAPNKPPYDDNNHPYGFEKREAEKINRFLSRHIPDKIEVGLDRGGNGWVVLEFNF